MFEDTVKQYFLAFLQAGRSANSFPSLGRYLFVRLYVSCAVCTWLPCSLLLQQQQHGQRLQAGSPDLEQFLVFTY